MVDVILVGGGLAGVTVHRELATLGIASIWYSLPSDNVPIAIAHPFAGRSLDVSADRLAAYELTLNWWRAVDPDDRFHRITPVRRVAPQGSRLHRSFTRTGDFPDWLNVRWQNDELVYEGGLTCKMDAFIQQYRTQHGCLEKSVSQIEPGEPATATVEGSHVTGQFILTTGPQMAEYIESPDLSPGELAVVEASSDEIRIGSGFHASASMEGQIGIGSTHEREGDSTAALRDALLDKAQTLVSWTGEPKWYRGVRLNALPLRTPQIVTPGPSVLGIAALGGKGLVWAPTLAKQLVRDHLEIR